MNRSDLEKLKAAYKASTPGNTTSVADKAFILQSHNLMPELLRIAEEALREKAVEGLSNTPKIDGIPVHQSQQAIHNKFGAIEILHSVELGWHYLRMGSAGYGKDFENLSLNKKTHEEPSYVAYSAKEAEASEGGGFWSNADGWVDVNSASLFYKFETKIYDLPITQWNDVKWISLDETIRFSYVNRVIQLYKTGQDNAYEVYKSIYGEAHEQEIDETDLDFIRRCAEQDFYDGETDAAVYQDVYNEITGRVVRQSNSMDQ